MALSNFKHGFFMVPVAISAIVQMTTASDPNIDADFVLPSDVSTVDGNFFTHTTMPALIRAGLPTIFKVSKASMIEFLALNGKSVSYATQQFPLGSVNPPHTHPRSAVLLFLLTGSLEVGFVNTSNKLYTQTLQAGDMFVFPKGLIHYQYNNNEHDAAFALSAFSSANAGTVSIPGTIFTTGVIDNILAKAFKTDVATIQRSRLVLHARPNVELLAT